MDKFHVSGLWTNGRVVYDKPLTLEEITKLLAVRNGAADVAQQSLLQRLKDELSEIHGGLREIVREEYAKMVIATVEESPEVQEAVFGPSAPNPTKGSPEVWTEVWNKNAFRLHEKHIGASLAERCLAILSDPTTTLGQQAHAWTHHVADLSIDLMRLQQESSCTNVKIKKVPDDVDTKLLACLEKEGLYRGRPLS
jgi:hypothetical protein